MSDFKQFVIAVVLVVLLIILWIMGHYTHEQFVPTATDSAMQKFGYEAPNSTGYRVKARAFYSCQDVESCPAFKDTAPSTNYVVTNPFVYPYSGSQTPQEVLAKAMPSGTLYVDTDMDHRQQPDHMFDSE